VNVVHLQGRLTNEPNLINIDKKDGTATQKVVFGLAMNERYRKESGEYIDSVTYVNCVAWDSGAALIHKFFHKGRAIIIHGKIINDNYEKDGEQIYKFLVRVNNFEFPLVEKVNGDSNGANGK
jgi:single-strand DNA-binding protein